MSLFISMLPLYLLGNLHCIGMCGPLVLFIGQHRFKNAYFLGRTLAFTTAGMIAGEIGAVAQLVFNRFHLPALTTFIFGILLVLLSVKYFTGYNLTLGKGISNWMSKLSKKISMLLLRDQFFSVFLFGLSTVLLPCGQSFMVFSACALSGDPWVGAFNGFAFAILTSPSLWFAMRAHRFLLAFKKYYHPLLGVFALVVGTLAILRGLAEMQLVPHLILNPQSTSDIHLVIF